LVRFTAEPEDEGRRIDVVLAARAGITRVRAQRALRSGEVLVDGAPARPSHRLERGQVVAGSVPEPELDRPQPEDIPLEIRYRDDRVIVVSKPAGLVVHPARGHEDGTLVNALLGLGVSLAGEGSVRPGIVHRLDKDTSGLLLVARDDDAQAHLVDAIQRRAVERLYLAAVGGTMPAASGTVDAPLGRHPVKRRLMAVVDGGRPAVTHYRVLDTNGELSLLEVKLETGRTHQIRVHLAHIGHPVTGDRVYGGRPDRALNRPWLHAFRLSFPHPDDGRPVVVTDPPPRALSEALAGAGLSVPPDLF
jgi:23S rRNA pseudouridine1911/1915/1917 synthase